RPKGHRGGSHRKRVYDAPPALSIIPPRVNGRALGTISDSSHRPDDGNGGISASARPRIALRYPGRRQERFHREDGGLIANARLDSTNISRSLARQHTGGVPYLGD